MNEITRVFSYQGSSVRTVVRDGEPWFVAKDVCEILGLEQVSRAMDRLDEDERGLSKVTHPQNPAAEIAVNVVSEPGVYQLVMASNKPEAKAFKRWITHEVIPSIRKTGSYSVAVPQTLPEALRLAADLAEQKLALEAKVIEDKPKVDFHDRVTALDGDMTMEAAAKNLGMGRNRLFAALRDLHVLRPNNLPLQEYIDRGYFRVILSTVRFGGEERPYSQTVVTVKGLAFIQRILSEHQAQAV